METISAVTARPKDINSILRMEKDFYSLEGLVFKAGAMRAAMDQLLRKPSLGRVLLINAGTETVGYAILTWSYSIEFHGRFALLDEFFVKELHRREGIGSHVLENILLPLCKREGINALRLEVEHRNSHAKSLYRRRGFKEHDRTIMTHWLKS